MSPPSDTPGPHAPALAAAPPAPRDASRTAVGVALLRAAHQRLDPHPLILDDPVAASLVDAAALDAFVADPARVQSAESRGRRAHVVVRSRFAEDRLAAATARGVRQYVVLGAGLDTFAYRQPPWAAALAVFEVDHPASQHVKRDRLAAASIPAPANLTFVEVDFEAAARPPEGAARLAALLEAGGLRRDLPTLFSCLGVLMYLAADTVDAVFRAVAAFPAGSELVLTFAPPPPPGVDPADWPSPRHRTATAGEPWRTFFTPEALAARLRAVGFSTVEFLDPAAAAARYFRDRPGDLPVPADVTIAAATV